MRLHSKMFFALLFLSSFAAAQASGGKFGHQTVAFDAAKFAQQREQIQHELQRGERYSEIDEVGIREVKAALDRLDGALTGTASLDELDPKTKLSVFNDQELVNNILTQAAEDSRLICRRETPTGSHRPVNICKTVAERRIAKANADDLMRASSRFGGAEIPQGVGR